MTPPKKDVTSSADDPSESLKNSGDSLEYSNAPVVASEGYSDNSSSGPAGSVITPSASSSDNPDKPDGDNADNVRTDPALNAITPGKPVRAKRYPLQAIWERTNIYLLLFIFIIALLLVTVAVIYFRSKTTANKPEQAISSQKLSSETLQDLATNGVQVGDPKQVLNIQSNSVFAGTVLVKGEMQVAGGLKIGSGSLNIPDMNIGGTALINDLQTKTLAVASNTAIQGQLTVQGNLVANGGGNFNGPLTAPQVTTNKLQLTGDLILTKHIVAGGSIPGRVNSGALGSGGTSSISGSDTAGFISINTGNGASAGCLVTVNFTQAFNSTPHVMITPVGAGAASMSYYTNRTSSNFSLCSANAPPSNSSFGFDYFAVD